MLARYGGTHVITLGPNFSANLLLTWKYVFGYKITKNNVNRAEAKEPGLRISSGSVISSVGVLQPERMGLPFIWGTEPADCPVG